MVRPRTDKGQKVRGEKNAANEVHRQEDTQAKEAVHRCSVEIEAGWSAEIDM